MINSTSYHTRSGKTNYDDYERLFVPRVHKLLAMGYRKLVHRHYLAEEETAITGDLVAAVREIVDRPSQGWMRFFGIHEDPPVHERRRRGKTRRKGKSRRRVDIHFEAGQVAPRVRFRFECKRLSSRHSAKTYLGADGLGCFLCSAYASDDVRAGMLGYLQSDNPDAWASRIEKLLVSHNGKYAMRKDGAWRQESVTPELPFTFRSLHGRGPGRRPIDIYHTFLEFL